MSGLFFLVKSQEAIYLMQQVFTEHLLGSKPFWTLGAQQWTKHKTPCPHEA